MGIDERDKIINIFKDIKQNILLNYPDLNKEFILETDASSKAIGCILYQENRIVGIYSKKYSISEANYTNPEREMLAIIKTVRHFKTILYGATIKIKTDHKNLLSARYDKIDVSRIERWKLELQKYKIKYTYIKGSENVGADYNSRVCPVQQVSELKTIYPLENILKSQNKYLNRDMEKTKIIENLEICIKNNKIIIPEENKYEILNILHINLEHTGSVRMFLSLKTYIYCKKIQATINDVCKKCEIC